jgi:hypothetical protein
LPIPPHRVRFDLFNFLHESTHDYDGPNEGIVSYLNEHGKEGQFVKTNYGQFPILFYTKLKAIGYGQDLERPVEADWVIIRRGFGYETYLRSLLKDYEPIPIDYPDLSYGNPPDPGQHRYRTEKGGPQVILYERRRLP